MTPRLGGLLVAAAVAACAGTPDSAAIPDRLATDGVHIRGAAWISEGRYVVIGSSLDGGTPVAGLLDRNAIAPFQPLRHPLADTFEVRDITAIPGGYLVCGVAAANDGWLIQLQMDAARTELVEVARTPAPVDRGEAPTAVALAPPTGDRTALVIGFVGDGAAAARLRLGFLTAPGSIEWTDELVEVRAPVDELRSLDGIRDCEAIHIDADGSISLVATWRGPPADQGSSVLYRAGRIRPGQDVIEILSPERIWSGLGIVVDTVASHPSGVGYIVFGPPPSRAATRAPR